MCVCSECRAVLHLPDLSESPLACNQVTVPQPGGAAAGALLGLRKPGNVQKKTFETVLPSELNGFLPMNHALE